MANIFTGQRPDLTPAQIISGIPILAEALHAFGVYDLSRAQQDSLAKTATWAFALIGGDTLLRMGRGYAAARVGSAAVTAGASAAAPADASAPEIPVEDAEEFAAPPPSTPPIQPSQRPEGTV